MGLKTYGLACGNKIKAKFLKQGTSEKGKWQFFSYQESKKNNETGQYVKLRDYQVWLNTPIEDLKENDTLIINKIVSFYETQEEYNGKKYHKIQVRIEAEKFIPKPVDVENVNFDDVFADQDIFADVDVDNINFD